MNDVVTRNFKLIFNQVIILPTSTAVIKLDDDSKVIFRRPETCSRNKWCLLLFLNHVLSLLFGQRQPGFGPTWERWEGDWEHICQQRWWVVVVISLVTKCIKSNTMDKYSKFKLIYYYSAWNVRTFKCNFNKNVLL